MPPSILRAAQSPATETGGLAEGLETGGDTIRFGDVVGRIEPGDAVIALEAFELDRQG